MIVTKDQASINSTLIVSLAKQALNNLPYYEKHRRQFFGSTGEDLFRQEYGTVKIGLPRQSGHSTAALQLMYEYPGSLLFVHDHSARDYMRNHLRQYTDDPDTRARINMDTLIPDQRLITQVPHQASRAFIILDQVSMMSPPAIAIIKEAFAADIILELQ